MGEDREKGGSGDGYASRQKYVYFRDTLALYKSVAAHKSAKYAD